MPPRRRRSTTIARSQRRKLVWATFDQTLPALAVNAVTSVDLLNQFELAGASHLGVTIMRTHVRLQLTNMAAPADAVPIGFVVARLSDVGTARVDPNAESDLDWLYIDRLMADSMGAGGTITANPVYTFDLRAKRKMQEMSQAYVFAVKNLTGSAAFSPRLYVRTLVALP